jgi:hypothetical protein
MPPFISLIMPALANGGTACEEPPVMSSGDSSIASLRDSDGNKLCALHLSQ